jgi:hypothetical protein
MASQWGWWASPRPARAASSTQPPVGVGGRACRPGLATRAALHSSPRQALGHGQHAAHAPPPPCPAALSLLTSPSPPPRHPVTHPLVPADPVSEEEAAKVAAYPFTTIDPNVGRAFIALPDPAPLLGLPPVSSRQHPPKNPPSPGACGPSQQRTCLYQLGPGCCGAPLLKDCNADSCSHPLSLVPASRVLMLRPLTPCTMAAVQAACSPAHGHAPGFDPSAISTAFTNTRPLERLAKVGPEHGPPPTPAPRVPFPHPPAPPTRLSQPTASHSPPQPSPALPSPPQPSPALPSPPQPTPAHPSPPQPTPAHPSPPQPSTVPPPLRPVQEAGWQRGQLWRRVPVTLKDVAGLVPGRLGSCPEAPCLAATLPCHLAPQGGGRGGDLHCPAVPDRVTSPRCHKTTLPCPSATALGPQVPTRGAGGAMPS